MAAIIGSNHSSKIWAREKQAQISILACFSPHKDASYIIAIMRLEAAMYVLPLPERKNKHMASERTPTVSVKEYFELEENHPEYSL